MVLKMEIKKQKQKQFGIEMRKGQMQTVSARNQVSSKKGQEF